MSRLRIPKLSESYYGDEDTTLVYHRYHTAAETDAVVRSMSMEFKGTDTKQSRRIPEWAWWILAKSLGIKTWEFDKPWFGTVLYVLSLTAALTHIVTHSWFVCFDVISAHTRLKLFDGFIAMFLCIFWSFLGIYANRLASNLFSHPKFRSSVRLHAKTIFKMNAVFILASLSICVAFVRCWSDASLYRQDNCVTIAVHPALCNIAYISQIVMTVFSTAWNILVATVLLSVCRTHTIGIRRFVRELLVDATFMEENLLASEAIVPCAEEQAYLWDDDFSPFVPLVRTKIPSQSLLNREHSESRGGESEPTKIEPSVEPGFNLGHSSNDSVNPSPRELAELSMPVNTLFVEENQPHKVDLGGTEVCGDILPDPAAFDEQPDNSSENVMLSRPKNATLTPDDVLNSYWRIAKRLQATSLHIERWTSSMMAYLVFFTVSFIARWFNSEPHWHDIVQFILPMLILFLLASAFGEVNNEGQRVINSIYPSTDRLMLIRHLRVNPLQLRLFGFPLTYGTVLTVMLAVSLTIISRVIVTEINKPS